MARKKGLKQYSEEELVRELAHRHASQHFREGMTLTEIELSIDAMLHKQGEPSIALMLSRMKPEAHRQSLSQVRQANAGEST